MRDKSVFDAYMKIGVFSGIFGTFLGRNIDIKKLNKVWQLYLLSITLVKNANFYMRI